MKNYTLMLTSFIVFVMLISAGLAFAQMPQIPTEGDFAQTFNQLVELFKNWSVISVQAKVALVLVLVIGLIKNSALQPYFNFFGKWKPIVAPALSLVVALLYVQPFTFATFLAAVTTGIAAGYFAQLLDMLKTIPAIGDVTVTVIDLIGKLLKRPDLEEEK